MSNPKCVPTSTARLARANHVQPHGEPISAADAHPLYEQVYAAGEAIARGWSVPTIRASGIFQTSENCRHEISGDLVEAPANDVAMVVFHLVVASGVGVFASSLTSDIARCHNLGKLVLVVSGLT